MNRLCLSIGVALAVSGIALGAEDYIIPATIDGMYGQKVNRAGSLVIGQDMTGTLVISYEVATQKTTMYEAYYPGNGNCGADNGMIVGQTISNSGEHAAVMWSGKAEVPSALKDIGLSALEGITPDGSRACGYMTNTSSGVMSVPFYVDIIGGRVGKANPLPYPKKDFFGGTPQFVTAVWISDDGKTIAGMVRDGNGFYTWPIIYSQDDNKQWSYSLPSASLFNPDNLPALTHPEDIKWGENGAPAPPDYLDYMTASELQAWLEALQTNPDIPPFDFMSDEENKAFDAAAAQFSKEANAYQAEAYDRYWDQIYQMGRYEMFQGFPVLSPDGKWLVVDNGISDEETTSDFISTFVPYVFDLEAETHTTINTGKENLLPTQILSDGSIVAITLPSDFVPYVAYVLRPGEEEFMTFTSFLEEKVPSYYYWLEDNLGRFGIIGYNPDGTEILGNYIVTGWVSVSDDMKVVVGGLPVGDILTYVYYDPSGAVGVDEIAEEATVEETYTVYTLSGIRLLNAAPKSALEALPAGLYIVNGRKLLL